MYYILAAWGIGIQQHKMFTKAVKLTSFGGLISAGFLANNNDSLTGNDILVQNQPQPNKIELEPKTAIMKNVDKYQI